MDSKDRVPAKSSTREVEAFLRQVALAPRTAPAAEGRGRLVFAMDATASRRATWNEAQRIQADMFRTTAADIHAVAGLVQEYVCVDHLAHRDAPTAPDWQQAGQQLEHCLRLYLAGNPIGTAKRLSGYPSA